MARYVVEDSKPAKAKPKTFPPSFQPYAHEDVPAEALELIGCLFTWQHGSHPTGIVKTAHPNGVKVFMHFPDCSVWVPIAQLEPA